MATRINRYLDSVSAFDNIEIDLIRFPGNPLRQREQDLSGLMDSIRANGLLQPIVVRPRGDRFEVVAGNRRLEACKRLKHRKIKSMVLDLDDKTAYELAITENVQRRTLGPIEEGIAFKKYCEEYGWGSQTELAKKIGKSQEYISHRIKLLTLPEEVKNALNDHQISLASAEEIVWMKDDSAKKKLIPFLSEQKLNMHDVRDIVRAMNSGGVSGVEKIFADGNPPQRQNSQEEEMERDYVNTISESVLIVRIALVRIDDLISRTKDNRLKQMLVSKRIVLHSLVDELVAAKKHGLMTPQLIGRPK